MLVLLFLLFQVLPASQGAQPVSTLAVASEMTPLPRAQGLALSHEALPVPTATLPTSQGVQSAPPLEAVPAGQAVQAVPENLP